MDNCYFHDLSLSRAVKPSGAFVTSQIALEVDANREHKHCLPYRLNRSAPGGTVRWHTCEPCRKQDNALTLQISFRPHNVVQRTEPANNGRLQSGSQFEGRSRHLYEENGRAAAPSQDERRIRHLCRFHTIATSSPHESHRRRDS